MTTLMAWSLSGPRRCFDGKDLPQLVVEAAAGAKTIVAVRCEEDVLPADSADVDVEDVLHQHAHILQLRIWHLSS